MQEELVSPRAAKLAKELKFCEPCNHVLFNDTVYSNYKFHKTFSDAPGQIIFNFEEYEKHNKLPDRVSIPTQAFLQKWLRNTHSIHADAYVARNSDERNPIVIGYYAADVINGYGKVLWENDKIIYSTYEKALEVSLLGALEYLKRNK